jgi:hypothetical protein
MIGTPRELRMLRVPTEADQGAALDEFAAAFAERSVAETEVLIGALSNAAIAQWRLTDAMFWQRVRFRARRIRAGAPLSSTDGR